MKSTAGNSQLGGDDWDQRIIDWLVKTFKDTEGVDLSADKMATQRLKEAAEKAKIELSSLQETQINLPFITATSEGPKHLDVKLTRATFNELTADWSTPARARSIRPSPTRGCPSPTSTTSSWWADRHGSRPFRSWSNR